MMPLNTSLTTRCGARNESGHTLYEGLGIRLLYSRASVDIHHEWSRISRSFSERSRPLCGTTGGSTVDQLFYSCRLSVRDRTTIRRRTPSRLDKRCDSNCHVDRLPRWKQNITDINLL